MIRTVSRILPQTLKAAPLSFSSRAFTQSRPIFNAEKPKNPADFLTMGTMNQAPKSEGAKSKRQSEEDEIDPEEFAKQERLKKAADDKYEKKLSKNLKLTMVILAAMTAGGVVYLGMPESEEEKNEENQALGYLKRAWGNFGKFFEVGLQLIGQAEI